MIYQTRFLVASCTLLLLQGCGVLGYKSTGAPVDTRESPAVIKPAPATVPAPAPATVHVPPRSTVLTPSTRPAPAAQPSPPARTSTAMQNLRLAAARQQQAGEYNQAAATLERALRIAPRDAKLWQQLAQVRLDQKKWSLALNMAAKSNALARDQRSLQRKNWLIMAQAYRALGQSARAKDAEQRARALLSGE